MATTSGEGQFLLLPDGRILHTGQLYTIESKQNEDNEWWIQIGPIYARDKQQLIYQWFYHLARRPFRRFGIQKQVFERKDEGGE